MRERIVVAAVEVHAIGDLFVQALEEMLVAGLAAAEDGQRNVVVSQQVGQDGLEQLDALLGDQARHDTEQRTLEIDGQPEVPHQLRLALALAREILGAVVGRDMGIRLGVPLAVIDAVQDADQRRTAITQQVLQAHAVLLALYLPGVGGAHGGARCR